MNFLNLFSFLIIEPQNITGVIHLFEFYVTIINKGTKVTKIKKNNSI